MTTSPARRRAAVWTSGIWRWIPLHQQFQGWNAGDASNLEMDEAIRKMHKACQKVYSLCATKRDFLVSAIQFNEDWFPGWEKDHPRPRDLYCRTYLRLRDQFA